MTGHVGHGAESGAGAERFSGARIPDQPFAADDGGTPPAVGAALETWRGDGDLRPVVEALLPTRLLVGLVAVLDSTDAAGSEKDSHMAAAMLVRPDGRKALVAFTSVAGLTAWQAEARPLPVRAVDAARAAIEDDADALLIDGDCALTGPFLWALAEGRVPRPPAEDDDVRAAVGEVVDAVLGEAGLSCHHWLVADHSGAADVVVLLDSTVAGQPATVAELARQLAAHPLLRSRLVKGLALGVDPA